MTVPPSPMDMNFDLNTENNSIIGAKNKKVVEFQSPKRKDSSRWLPSKTIASKRYI